MILSFLSQAGGAEFLDHRSKVLRRSSQIETIISSGIMPMKDGEDCSCEGIGEDLDVCSCDVFGIGFLSVYGFGC